MRKIILPLLALCTLSACAEVELASHVAKQMPIPEESKTTGYFKVGTPYKIAGRWYRPQERYSYTETGIASWYGPNFHGKKTANGEIFDMHELTAAHKTLQIPSIVRVTNLENNKSVIVRINDRGPYSKGRVIDLSKKAAQELDFIGQGTAQVKIQVLGDESREVASIAKSGQKTRGMELAYNNRRPPLPSVKPVTPQPVYVQAQAQAPSPAIRTQTIRNELNDTSIFVQAGAFGSSSNAQTLATALRGYGPANVHNAAINGQNLYRVRLGPFPTQRQAEMVLAQINQSGKAEAFLVID